MEATFPTYPTDVRSIVLPASTKQRDCHNHAVYKPPTAQELVMSLS